MAEKIEIGYVNSERKHALISVVDPALANTSDALAQIAITIDGAIALRAALNVFLARHGVQSH